MTTEVKGGCTSSITIRGNFWGQSEIWNIGEEGGRAERERRVTKDVGGELD
jgi:hypothetical protein